MYLVLSRTFRAFHQVNQVIICTHDCFILPVMYIDFMLPAAWHSVIVLHCRNMLDTLMASITAIVLLYFYHVSTPWHRRYYQHLVFIPEYSGTFATVVCGHSQHNT